jgi:hypothetical protein
MSIKNFIKDFLLEQDENLITITPDEYLDMVDNVGGMGSRIPLLKQFKGKGIVIDGDLDLSKHRNIGSLDGIVRIKGRLDMTNTNISNIDNITVDGYVTDYNSVRYLNKLKSKRNTKLSQLEEFRKNEEWNVENGEDDSERTEALYEFLVEEGVPTLYEDENGNEVEEDKYFIYPNGSGTYGYGKQYEWLGGDALNPDTYDVYVDSELEDAAKVYVKQVVDDMGFDAFRDWVWDSAIDTEKWENWLFEFYYEIIEEDPENYEIEKELNAQQENQVKTLNLTIENLTKKLNNPNLTDEEKKTIQNKIYGLTETIEEIESDPEGDYDNDLMISLAKTYADEYVDDIAGFTRNYGYDNDFMMDFIDLDRVAEVVADSDGYGQLLNSYDGEMFETKVNGTWYYVMRVS